MYNQDYERPQGEPSGYSSEAQDGQERWIWMAGGLSLVFAAVAAVLLIMARRRRPTRLERA